jgi:6,7-dimethyl-8-ribityllumazine synthase
VSGHEYDDRALAERRAMDEESSEESVEPSPDAPEPDEPAWPARDTASASAASAPPEPDAEPDAPAEAAAEPRAETPESSNGAVAAAEEEPSSEAVVEEEVAEERADVEQGADEDPFAAWPQPQSGVVIEDAPEEGATVQHVEGEIDVPDGYTVLEGMPLGKRRSVAVVVSRFNGGLTNRMLARALDALEEAEVESDAVTVVPVPGAFELPLAAMALAKTRRFACVVALGAIVRGETPHFDYVASEAASGLQLAAIETGVPVAFGVLTVETVEQGEARIDRAGDAVRSALEMADLFARLRATAH